MTIDAVRHAGAKDDAVLAEEAHAHLAGSPPLQLVAELLIKLRRRRVPWWTPEQLRSIWSVTARFEWWRDRPDVRQRITTAMTGLMPKAARKKDPSFQGALIDAAIDDGDVEVVAFEDACDPRDFAAYGPAVQIWRTFRDRFPWDQDTPIHQEVIAWLFHTLVAGKSSLEKLARPHILTHWELRRAIDPKLWQSKLPLEVRVAIDDARLTREHDKPHDPFRAEDELALATPEVIAGHIPLRSLQSVLDAAEKAMGFAGIVVEVARPAPGVEKPEKAEKAEKPAPKQTDRPVESVLEKVAAKEPEKPAAKEPEKPVERVEEKPIAAAEKPTATNDAFEVVEALAASQPPPKMEDVKIELAPFDAPTASAPVEAPAGSTPEEPAAEAKPADAAPAEGASESTPKPDDIERRDDQQSARVVPSARGGNKDLFAPIETRLTPMPRPTPLQAPPPAAGNPPSKAPPKVAPLPPRKSAQMPAAAPVAPHKPPSPPPKKEAAGEKKAPDPPVDSKRTTIPPPSGDDEWIPITTDPISADEK